MTSRTNDALKPGRPRGLQTHGTIIRTRREQCYLTQVELAELAGTTPKTVHRAEKGGPVSAGIAREIAKALALSLISVVRPSYEDIAERLAASGLAPPLPPSVWLPRPAELNAASEHLATGGDRPCIVGLSGPVGIGKSSIAARIAELTAGGRHRNVVWVDGYTLSSPVRVAQSLGMIGAALGLGDARGERSFRRLLWEQDVLVVLDDVRDDAVVEAFIGEELRCRCVITTYFRHIAERWSTRVVEVGGLDEVASMAVLEAAVEGSRLRADPSGTADLVELLGGVPRSIRQAARALQREHLTTPSMYAMRLRGRPLPHFERSEGAARQLEVETQQAHFAPFLELRASCSPGAWDLFTACAVFGDAAFPISWATALLDLEPSDAARHLGELIDLYLVNVAHEQRHAVSADAWLHLDTHAQILTRALVGSGMAAVMDRLTEHLIAEQRRITPVNARARIAWLDRHRDLLSLVLEHLEQGLEPLPPLTTFAELELLPPVAISALRARQLCDILSWFDLDLVHYPSDITSARLSLAVAAARTHRAELPISYARIVHVAAWWRATSSLGWESGRSWFLEASRVQREAGDGLGAAASLSMLVSPLRGAECAPLLAEVLLLVRGSGARGEVLGHLLGRIGLVGLIHPTRAAWSEALARWQERQVADHEVRSRWLGAVTRANVATARWVLGERDDPAELEAALLGARALLSSEMDGAARGLIMAHGAYFGLRMGTADPEAALTVARAEWMGALLDCPRALAPRLTFFIANALWFIVLGRSFAANPELIEPMCGNVPIDCDEGLVIPGLAGFTAQMAFPALAAAQLVDAPCLDALDSLSPFAYSDGSLFRMCIGAMRQVLNLAS